MAEEKKLTEEESLRLITEMIHTAKNSFRESGTDAILWGSAVAIAGLLSFAQRYWNFSIGFDIWLIVLAAFIPQIIISIRESKKRKAVSHRDSYMDAIWLVFGLSIFMLTFYLNTVPGIAENLLRSEGKELWIKNMSTGAMEHYTPTPLSGYSLLLLLYAMPTLATGIADNFKPMIIGGILCYIYFIISCFTPATYDLLLNGLAGLTNWLIPGLIIRSAYLNGKNC
jgi:formate-dependent nitrite reductase membrane component NrfD